MNSLRRGNLGALAVVLALGLLALATSSAQAAPKSFYGVVPQTPLVSEDFARMGQAKVGLLRFELFWAAADPTPQPGDYDWAAPDNYVREAARNGIRVLPFVYSTPRWVAEDLDGHTCGDGCNPFAPRSAAARQAWSEFLAAAVRRYGPEGEFWTLNPDVPRLPVRAWQLWNEGNSPSFYKPKPNVRAFAKLIKSGHDAIVAEDPGAEIVLGGMFGTPLQGIKPAIAAWDFLERLYRIKGAKKTFDGVAPHPYAANFKKKGTQRTVLGQIELFRDEIEDAGDDAELWITELGWASDGDPNPLNRGRKGQAKRLKEAFKYLTKRRNKLNIRTVNWYSWRDDPRADAPLCEWCPFSGLVDEAMQPKPALRAFTKFTGGS